MSSLIGFRISAVSTRAHVGGCQNYGPFLGTLLIKCRIILGIQKGTIIFDNHECERPTGASLQRFKKGEILPVLSGKHADSNLLGTANLRFLP